MPERQSKPDSQPKWIRNSKTGVKTHPPQKPDGSADAPVTFVSQKGFDVEPFQPEQASLIDLGRLSSGPTALFLDIAGIKGGSTDAKHKDEIEVLSWSWGASQAGTLGSGGGAGAGKVTFQDMQVKLPPRFTASLSTNQTFAHLPEGDFTARILTANAGYSASPALSFFNLVQYDNRSRNLGWQSRVRWTLRPGSDFFASFQQGWIREEDDLGDARLRAQDRKASVKLQYSIRF